MVEPKKPQDRKPKAARTEVMGITVSIDADTLDDWDFTEALAVVQDGSDATDAEKLVAMSRMVKVMLGDDVARVKRELRAQNDGRLRNETMLAFIQEALEAVSPNS